MPFITDMNQRERNRYITQIEAHAKACNDLIDALRAANDTEALIALLRVSLGECFLSELIDIFQSAQSVEIPDHPPMERP